MLSNAVFHYSDAYTCPNIIIKDVSQKPVIAQDAMKITKFMKCMNIKTMLLSLIIMVKFSTSGGQSKIHKSDERKNLFINLIVP